MAIEYAYDLSTPTGAEATGLICVSLFFAVATVWAFTQLFVYIVLQPKPRISLPKAFHLLVAIFSGSAFNLHLNLSSHFSVARFGLYIAQVIYGWNTNSGVVLRRVAISGFFTAFSIIAWNW